MYVNSKSYVCVSIHSAMGVFYLVIFLYGTAIGKCLQVLIFLCDT